MDDGRNLKFMNDSIYDFFKANYGTIKSTKQASKSFHVYKDFTVKQLKIELVQLKSQGANFAGTKYVSHLLRSRLGSTLGASLSLIIMIVTQQKCLEFYETNARKGIFHNFFLFQCSLRKFLSSLFSCNIST